jgi:hypothetical protein
LPGASEADKEPETREKAAESGRSQPEKIGSI